MAWTTPRTWVAGEVVTAALLNAQMRDNLNAIVVTGVGQWTTYAATWTGSVTNPTYAVNHSRYCQFGKLVVWNSKFSLTAAGSGTYGFPLPVATSMTLYESIGQGHIYDVSGDDTWLIAFDNGASSTTARGIWDQRSASGLFTAASPFAAANTDTLRFFAVYAA